MEIKFLGHSSFKITSKGKTVVTDPFDTKMVGLKFPAVSADVVTVSHDHHDHNQVNLVTGVKKVLSGPGEYEIEGISFIGLESFHDNEKGRARGRNTIFVMEFDEARIVHLGDLGHKLDEGSLNEIGEVDIAMIPVGGVFTIDSQQAAEVARAIDPGIVLPMHYYMPGLNKQVFSELESVDSFLTKVALKTEKLEKIVLKEGGFMEQDQKVVILAVK